MLAQRKEVNERDQMEERDKRILYEDQLLDMLNSLNPEGFVVRAYSLKDLAKREDYTTLDRECMIILKNKQRELNDTLALACLRYSEQAQVRLLPFLVFLNILTKFSLVTKLLFKISHLMCKSQLKLWSPLSPII